MSEIKHQPSFGSSGDSLFQTAQISRIDQFTRIVKDSCPEAIAAKRSLTNYLESAISQLDPFDKVERVHKGIAEKTLMLVGYLDQLKYEDYRNLGGLVTHLRDQPEKSFLQQCLRQTQAGNSPEVCQIVATLEGIFNDLSQLYKDSKVSFLKANPKGGYEYENPIGVLAMDTINLMRVACNQGINILQPQWTDINACLNPQRPAQIFLGFFSPSQFTTSNTVFIDPLDQHAETTAIRHKLNHKYHTVELRDGESVFLGRNLRASNQQIFKLGLNQKTVSSLDSAVKIPDSHISRAGIRILKLDGIYVFNNLCRTACMLGGETKSNPDKYTKVIHRGSHFQNRDGWGFGESRYYGDK